MFAVIYSIYHLIYHVYTQSFLHNQMLYIIVNAIRHLFLFF